MSNRPKLHSRPPLLRAPACPDCPAVFDDRNHLQHAETCPIAVAAERVCGEDREWFAQHPGALRRQRPITPAEVEELRAVGALPDVPGEAVGNVTVTATAVAGCRIRTFDDVIYILAGGDHLA